MLQLNVAVSPGGSAAATEPVPAASRVPAIRPLFAPAQSGAVERALIPVGPAPASARAEVIDAEVIEAEVVEIEDAVVAPRRGRPHRAPVARAIAARSVRAAYASSAAPAPVPSPARVA